MNRLSEAGAWLAAGSLSGVGLAPLSGGTATMLACRSADPAPPLPLRTDCDTFSLLGGCGLAGLLDPGSTDLDPGDPTDLNDPTDLADPAVLLSTPTRLARLLPPPLPPPLAMHLLKAETTEPCMDRQEGAG
jgi:hypothetical protein